MAGDDGSCPWWRWQPRWRLRAAAYTPQAMGVLRPQLLSSESMAREHIFASTDVTDAPSWLVPAFPITRERAIQLAQVDLGLSRAPAGVLITKAGVIPAGAARDVWVVLFAINQKGPMGEPSGAPVSTTVYTLAGELFDAQTGEFYYGFMQ